DLVVLNERDVHNQVSVLGHVNRPGSYDLEDNLTVMTLMSQAGGPMADAALSKAFVMRGTTKLALNLVPTLLKGQSDTDTARFQFQQGDVLMIPEITARFAVMGQVSHPGNYPIS